MILLYFFRIKNSLHYSRVLINIIANHEFFRSNNIPYHGNVKYSNFNYIMISYQDIYYYLKKQSPVWYNLVNIKVLFNLQYISFQNAIKQIFVVDKK